MEIEHAVQSAKAFASKSLGPERTANIRLEEIESSLIDGRAVWLITLSSESPHDPIAPITFGNLSRILGADADREYKIFTVTKDTGEVLTVKIRLLATPGV
jgi:hypothetical protein